MMRQFISKGKFQDFFGKQPLSKSKPHITLGAFIMDTKHQDFLIDVLNRLSDIEKFKLVIRGFDIFDNANVLFLKISKSKEIELLHERVKSLYSKNLVGKIESFNVSTTPHITISKTDGKKMLRESLEFFNKNDYHRQIEVTHLTLVSRSNFKTWDWEHHIELS